MTDTERQDVHVLEEHLREAIGPTEASVSPILREIEVLTGPTERLRVAVSKWQGDMSMVRILSHPGSEEADQLPWAMERYEESYAEVLKAAVELVEARSEHAERMDD